MWSHILDNFKYSTEKEKSENVRTPVVTFHHLPRPRHRCCLLFAFPRRNQDKIQAIYVRVPYPETMPGHPASLGLLHHYHVFLPPKANGA